MVVLLVVGDLVCMVADGDVIVVVCLYESDGVALL